MRGTTKLAIGGYIAWFLMNIIASAAAPSDLPGFDPNARRQFEDQIVAANFLQGIGSLLLLMAIVCTIITLYRNVMDKNVNKTIHGDEINASGGSTVATHGSSVAQGGSSIVNSHINNSQVRDTLGKISSMAEEAALSDREKRSIELISEKLTRDPPPSKDEAQSYINDIIDIFKNSGPLLETVKSLLSGLRL